MTKTKTRKEVSKELTKEQTENQARIKGTIDGIAEVFKKYNTNLQTVIHETRTPEGFLVGSSAQVRVVLNIKEDEDVGDK